MLPAVSFLKAPVLSGWSRRSSDPLDEQSFLVYTINALQNLPEWKNMAVIITYDDSDGWYDHVMPPIASESKTDVRRASRARRMRRACGGQYQGAAATARGCRCCWSRLGPRSISSITP